MNPYNSSNLCCSRDTYSVSLKVAELINFKWGVTIVSSLVVLLHLNPWVMTLAAKWTHLWSFKNDWFLGPSHSYPISQLRDSDSINVGCVLNLERFKSSSVIECAANIFKMTAERRRSDMHEKQEKTMNEKNNNKTFQSSDTT